MAANEIRVEDVGNSLKGTVLDQDGSAYDLSGATVLHLILKKPDDSKITRLPTFVNTGTDGQIQYVFVSGDLDQAGNWRAQVYSEVGTRKLRTDILQFRVYPNL